MRPKLHLSFDVSAICEEICETMVVKHRFNPTHDLSTCNSSRGRVVS